MAYLTGLVRRDAPFVRTPEMWRRGQGLGRDRHGPYYGCRSMRSIVVELAIGIAYARVHRARAASRDLFPIAAFFAFWSAAHLWVGIATIPRG